MRKALRLRSRGMMNTKNPEADELWTPAQITTALWLDADDADTIVLNGSNVSAWGDKSGNGFTAEQATAAFQPTYNTTAEGGKPSISFDGSNSNQLTFPNSTGLTYPLKFGSSNFEIFCVHRPTATALNTNISIFFGARAFDTGWLTGYLNAKPFMRLYNNGERWVPTPMTDITVTTTLQILHCTAPRNATGTYRKDGNLLQSTTQNVGNQTMNISGPPVRIGAYSDASLNPTGFFYGTISEMILVSSTLLTTIERQKMEGYLAHKWGLTANLPNDHPYKSVAPTV